MFWVTKFAKLGGSLKGAIKEFTRMNGRMPSSAEMNKMETIIKDAQSNVIPFPKQKSSLAPKTTLKDPIDQRWASQEEWAAKMRAENKAAVKRFEEKFGKPEDRASGGLAGQLHLNQGGRVRFDKGGMSRRKFLQLMGGLAALPIVGKYFKLAKPAAKTLKAVEASNATGMPTWFPKLVDKVLKEGKDMGGTVERNIVKQVELPGSKTKVTVDHDLNTGDTIVDIGEGKHGWADGRHGQPTRLVLSKGEWMEPDMDLVTGKLKTSRKKKPVKTRDEFDVEEAEFTGGHPENIKYEDVSIEKYGNHASDFTEVEKYATGKNVDKYNLKGTKKREADEYAQGRAEMQAEQAAEEMDDFAKGGLAGVLKL